MSKKRDAAMFRKGGEYALRTVVEWATHRLAIKPEDLSMEKVEPEIPLSEGGVTYWFGLSYASYFSIPRAVLEAMPVEWQARWVEVMREVDETFDWMSILPDDSTYTVNLRHKSGRFLPDPLRNYRHPIAIPRRA